MSFSNEDISTTIEYINLPKISAIPTMSNINLYKISVAHYHCWQAYQTYRVKLHEPQISAKEQFIKTTNSMTKEKNAKYLYNEK